MVWTEDKCPICESKAISACRCPLNDRRCANGHWWRRDKLDDHPIVLDGPHGPEKDLEFAKMKWNQKGVAQCRT